MKITSFFGYFEGDVAESVVFFSIDLRLCRFDHVLIKLFLKAHFGRRERSDLILTWLAVDEVIEAVSIEFDGKRRNAPKNYFTFVLINIELKFKQFNKKMFWNHYNLS